MLFSSLYHWKNFNAKRLWLSTFSYPLSGTIARCSFCKWFVRKCFIHALAIVIHSLKASIPLCEALFVVSKNSFLKAISAHINISTSLVQ
ncbi:unnamed protein product [Meloidogyne enterolobii]|uniref:Uncharacterized protein n=1 Tax=Meloidogyne enterolobii TaxID=390850 RepID=A0ACB0XSH7_MELEN